MPCLQKVVAQHPVTRREGSNCLKCLPLMTAWIATTAPCPSSMSRWFTSQATPTTRGSRPRRNSMDVEMQVGRFPAKGHYSFQTDQLGRSFVSSLDDALILQLRRPCLTLLCTVWLACR
mmetsp:Transcript_45899/g.106715  ORF Transcript_45899/g.106715 Transcript_45899/m.106715 type:complete len:119 (-) Transcript_45899:17-373(-)